MEKGLTKNQLISELTRSPHGKLTEYVPIVKEAGNQDPEFLAHLIAWNQQKGSIRDSKVAIPVISLNTTIAHKDDLKENSLAHLGILGPRELYRAYRFAIELKSGVGKSVEKVVRKYLVRSEQDRRGWNYLAIQHRNTLKSLYGMSHQKPAKWVNDILFEHNYPAGSIFEKVAHLKDMSPGEAAGTILEYKVPFLIALGALGPKSKEPDLVQALISRMSPTELVTNTKMLEKLGVMKNPALKGAFEKALEKTSVSKKNVLKTTRAVEHLGDEHLKTKLRGVQDKQLQSISVEGNWVILCDKSGSMAQELEIAREIAGTLVKMAKGKVWLVFFDVAPQAMDVTGKPLDAIKLATRHISASGGTSIGCGLNWILAYKHEIDGIVIVSDAKENNVPLFVDVYKKYNETFGKEVPVYLYRCGQYMGSQNSSWGGDRDLRDSMKKEGFDLQEFDMNGVDFYSIPNLVAMMRTNKYSLVDEIMATPLLTLTEVFKEKVAIGA